MSSVDLAGRRAGPAGEPMGRSKRVSDPSRPGERRSPPAHRPSRGASSPAPFDDELETQRIFTVFGSNSRAGYWEPPERLEVMAVFGGVKLDFRDANLYSGVSVVNCLAMFGGIEIVVPPDLEIDANGTGLFGGFDQEVKGKRRGLLDRLRPDDELEPEYDPDVEPPLLKIRGFALFGGVNITVRRD